MYLADYHVHSLCSEDGTASMARMAAAAADAGLSEVCFTDHLDILPWGPYVPPEDFPAGKLAAAYDRAVEEAGGRLRVRLGLELGEMAADFALADRYMDQAPPLDFVIGSLHVMSERFGRLGFTQAARAAEHWDAVIGDYLAEELAQVAWGRFSVIGHLTLPLRYAAEGLGLDVSFAGHMDAVAQVLRLAVEKGVGIELNTNRGGMPLPGPDVLKLYRELGGEIVTLGSDAHRPEHIGLGLREGRALLCACGFSYFCTYEKMQPIFHKL